MDRCRVSRTIKQVFFFNSISKLVKGGSALLRFSVGFHDNREKAGNSATY